MYQIFISIGNKTFKHITRQFEITESVLRFKDCKTNVTIYARGNWYIEEIKN